MSTCVTQLLRASFRVFISKHAVGQSCKQEKVGDRDLSLGAQLAKGVLAGEHNNAPIFAKNLMINSIKCFLKVDES